MSKFLIFCDCCEIREPSSAEKARERNVSGGHAIEQFPSSRFPKEPKVLSATSAADKTRTINRRPPSFCLVCGLSSRANCSARVPSIV